LVGKVKLLNSIIKKNKTMSETTVNTEATGKTFFHLDDNGATVSVRVEGNAMDLMNLFANAMVENDSIRRVIEMALIAVDMREEDEGDDSSDKEEQE
jgi:hypothetical protein